MPVQMMTRNAGLADLRDLLVEQHARKIDIVAPASKIRSIEGQIHVKGVDAVITDDGVTEADGVYVPTAIFDEGVADKLRVPLAYVRRLREERPDLYDANVNGWLHGRRPKVWHAGMPDAKVIREAIPGDDRSFLIRAFRGDDPGSEGIARAFLSDRYAVMDNLDALTAALDGVGQAGVDVKIDGCDLTDRRMYVRIIAPEVKAYAETLLRNYRSPFSGNRGADNPTVFAGFVISNSETGGGAFTITPRLVVEVCNNGMTITKDALRAVHLGGRMDEGLIRWTQDTEEKQRALITAKARDAVTTFLDVEYMTRVLSEVEEKSGKRLENAEDVKVVTKRLQFTEEQTNRVFEMFIDGGDRTAGGVMSAVTAAARATDDPDQAADMESAALRALDVAAAL